ncbi:GNAT family N-acetyltransferase [Pseudonocardia acidicola]|uniref:bifunctional acetate--CoA ligase family protein/GNAT family N-acetyltransferase n=1 Tax=Pseudonocardia acidicola TaxID=2724939 RepID=UPI00308408EC
MSTAAAPGAAALRHRALLADGTPVLVRRLGADDLAEVERLHRELPLDDHYLRFFTASRAGSDTAARSIVGPDSVAVGAFRSARLIGVAHYRRSGEGTAPEDPEIAFAVAHDQQHKGVATLLLEHLTSLARLRGVRRLVADVLAINYDMLRVFADAGLPVTRRVDGEITHLVLELPPGTPPRGYRDAVLERESRADAQSLRPLLEPRSIVVIGAGRRRDSIGRSVLRRIVADGFTGPVYAVHPHAAAVAGVPCHRSVSELPPGVDLAVLCVPAAAVPEVAEQCGRAGVRALLVITSGISCDPVLAGGLTAAVERYGMRLVGPNCLGLVNTDPRVRLQATFCRDATAGPVGVAAQSGGVVIAILADLERLGLGVSTLVSTGDGADVSGDDLMLWWSEDDRTRAAVLYVESLRRPRTFAELARRLSRRMPVLTVRSGSTEVGARAAASHSAATATPRVVRDALFRQAGILAVDRLSELTELLALLCWQPLPAGPAVAVISNAGGPGVLAVDACVGYGLIPAELTEATRERLQRVLPATAAVGNPVDTTATVAAAGYGEVLAAVLADPGVDAVIAVGAATAAGDPLEGVTPAVRATVPGKPVLAARLGQTAAVGRLFPGRAGAGASSVGDPVAAPAGADVTAAPATVPCYADPAAAALALSRAVQRTRWLARARADTPSAAPDGIDVDRARAVVAADLARRPAGGWLDPAATEELLRAAGVTVAPTLVIRTLEDAVRRWQRIGGPVAIKADVPGVLHKSAADAVFTGLDSRRQVLHAVRELRSRFGDRLRAVVMQPMAGHGTELLVGVTSDPLCGPLLTVGLGGVNTDLVDDRAHCLVPVTDGDVDEVLAALRAGPRLFPPDAPGRGLARDVAVRLARLADLVPELAELEINPLVVSGTAAIAVDGRVRVVPAEPADPWLRRLPT